MSFIKKTTEITSSNFQTRTIQIKEHVYGTACCWENLPKPSQIKASEDQLFIRFNDLSKHPSPSDDIAGLQQTFCFKLSTLIGVERDLLVPKIFWKWPNVWSSDAFICDGFGLAQQQAVPYICFLIGIAGCLKIGGIDFGGFYFLFENLIQCIFQCNNSFIMMIQELSNAEFSLVFSSAWSNILILQKCCTKFLNLKFFFP